MNLNMVKRLALSGLLALSVTGGTLAPAMAGHAAAGSRGGLCVPPIRCPAAEAVNPAPPAGDAAAFDGVLNDGAKRGIASSTNRSSGSPGGVLGDGAKPGIASGSNRDGSKPGIASGSNRDGGR